MKKIFIIASAVMLMAIFFTGCSDEPIEDTNNTTTEAETQTETIASETETAAVSTSTTTETTTETTTVNNSDIPQEIAEIPEGYFSEADSKGTLADIYYNTYESFSYADKSQPLEKHAVVYLPYGYDETKKYNVFYLMHGGWGNENQTLGTPAAPSGFKNVIDNAIENEDFEPLIIVCPTYNNTSPQDSADFSLALQLNQNFHNELVNDLMPAVEGKYSTYAEGTDKEALMASRNHRGFGGFSMGSVATWRTFQNCLDYFSYFLPMSCGTTLDDDNIFAAAQGFDQKDYFVFSMTGTADFAYSYVNNRIDKMRRSPYFTEEENFAYRIKEGYDHGGTASMEYTYNGLCRFGKKLPADNISSKIYTVNTSIDDVINDSVFGDYGRLIFPVDKGYYSGNTLGDLSLTWYNNIDPNKTVEICNYMREKASSGDRIFYDIYTDEEKADDPEKADTGLFFFKGRPGEKFAVCNAGGGFAYVGAMHDSFPHALELSKKGYNAFALIYRPGWDSANEDLARAITFIFDHAEELGVDTDSYSVWGGSAGARMAANMGTYGPGYFGGADLPKPGTVIMQYTGHTDYGRNDPPTYACVGTNDSIADWRTMQSRLEAMSALGIPTEFHVYEGLRHGFGLGTGTAAEGWIDDAVAFWEKQMK